MTSEQRQLRQTLLFLRTSFEAVQHSIAGRLEDPLPCWLDTSMLSMLSRELTRCRQQAKPLFAPAVVEQLFIASQQCDLSSSVCHRQLSAIMLPLTSAISQIDTPVKRRWPWAKWK